MTQDSTNLGRDLTPDLPSLGQDLTPDLRLDSRRAKPTKRSEL